MSIVANEYLEALDILEHAAASTISSTDAQQQWDQIAQAAKQLANNLTSEDTRTSLAKAGLVHSCAKLLPAATDAPAPQAVTQLLRAVGNLCFDHNVNRQLCLDQAIPAAVLEVLASAHAIPSSNPSSPSSPTSKKLAPTGDQDGSTLDHLTLVRAAVGAILNMSLEFDPIKEELRNPAALSLFLSLLDSRSIAGKPAPIYRVNSWAQAVPAGSSEEVEEVWKNEVQIRSAIAGWVMSILDGLLSDDKASFPPSGVSTLASIILSSQASLSSDPPPSSPWSDEDSSDLLDTDLELLTQSASLLEALSIDQETAKQEIAFAIFDPHPPTSERDGETTLLSHLFSFIESSTLPSNWTSIHSSDPTYATKAFSTIKSAVVRAVVEAPNSDVVMARLFAHQAEGDGGKKKNWILQKLVSWIGANKTGREDLLICAAHMLAALGRKDEHCVILVQDYGLAPPLAALVDAKVKEQMSKDNVRPGEVTQILFGVVSLLRHLSIPVLNKSVLGETGIIPTVTLLLRRELDMVSPLQNAVIGLLKHLTASNLINSLYFIGVSTASPDLPQPMDTDSAPTALDATLSLISRTDDIRIRSEASRTLVNVVRSFFSAKAQSGDASLLSPITPSTATTVGPESATTPKLSDEESMKRKGRPLIVRHEVVTALSEMVRLSEKYPMLINEGVVGLTLLAGSGAAGVMLVLDALLLRHEPPAPPPPSSDTSASSRTPSRTTSLAVTAAGDPPTSLGMLVTWLGMAASGKLSTGDPSLAPTSTTSTPSAVPAVRPEMVTNTCALVITVLRAAEVAKVDKHKIDQLRVQVLGPLHGAAETSEGALKKAATRALEVVEGR
ncbi:hypothetical protein T439DRAFT_327961 [Meredithblackwellia eburnea MCA 4105]